jgi:ribosomal protein S18 acetylase RimI-like enzyme
MGVSVRDATLADAAGIAAVQNRTWQHAYAHAFPADALATLDDERRAEWWRGVFEQPPARSQRLVVDGEQGIVGFAASGPSFSEPLLGELYSIYVLPEASGRGIGQALMAETLNRLRDSGFTEAILWVLEDNPRTRRFYEAAGWRADGGVKDETWLDTAVRELRYRIELDASR